MSWNHLICVCREPEFQTVFPSPRAWKKGVSSDVAPVMAKFAPRWNDALCALDGGSSGKPSSCAARQFIVDQNQKANKGMIQVQASVPMKSMTSRPSEQRPVGYPK